MTAFERTFRKTKRKKLLPKFDLRISKKQFFIEQLLKSQKARIAGSVDHTERNNEIYQNNLGN